MKTLDAIELRELTGYKNGSTQARWVRENLKLEPLIGADGHPRLTWPIIEQAALARRIGTMPAPVAAPGVSLPFTPKWKKAA